MDIRLKGDKANGGEPRSRIYLDASIAGVVRKLARYERCTMDELLTRMVRAWVKHERPKLVLDHPRRKGS